MGSAAVDAPLVEGSSQPCLLQEYSQEPPQQDQPVRDCGLPRWVRKKMPHVGRRASARQPPLLTVYLDYGRLIWVPDAPPSLLSATVPQPLLLQASGPPMLPQTLAPSSPPSISKSQSRSAAGHQGLMVVPTSHTSASVSTVGLWRQRPREYQPHSSMAESLGSRAVALDFELTGHGHGLAFPSLGFLICKNGVTGGPPPSGQPQGFTSSFFPMPGESALECCVSYCFQGCTYTPNKSSFSGEWCVWL